MLSLIAPSVIQGLGTYFSASAQKKAQQESYYRQERELAEQQALETESLNKGLDYEQAIANRGIGEQAAATGMTGSAITRRLGDIGDARKEAFRKFSFSQLMQKRSLEANRREQELQQKAAQKAQIYQGLGEIGGKIAGSMLTPKVAPSRGTTTSIYKQPDFSNISPSDYSLPNPFTKPKPTYSLRDAIKSNTQGGYYSNQWGS